MNPKGVAVTARSDGDTVLIVIEGEIDLSNADYVEAELAGAISNRTMSAAIDLTRVTYVDSIGMRVLFELAARLDTAQIGLKLIAPAGSPARRVIEISGLTAVIDIEPHV